MGNREHMSETIVYKIATFHRHQKRNAMADGYLSPEEREEIEMTATILEYATEANERRQFADYIERGGDPNAYANRMAVRIGMKITHLEEHRGRVVAFPGQQQHG